MPSSPVLTLRHGFSPVVVATGHLTDAPDRPRPRFPEAAVESVEARIGDCLDRWEMGPGGLLICGGARGGDLLAAEAALARGATVWVLLAVPAERFAETSVAGGDDRWLHRFWSLLARVPSWSMAAPAELAGSDEVFAAANEWMLEVAERQAGGQPVHLLAVWDGNEPAGPGGAGDMAARAAARGATIEVIDPI